MKKLLLFIVLMPIIAFSQNKKYALSMDMGITTNGHLPISFNYEENKISYGVMLGFPLINGTSGENYSSTINWDEYSTDTKKEGHFYMPISFDLGYRVFDKVLVGAGLGYAIKYKYRNKYDNYHILGNNGKYYIQTTDGGMFEYKAFAQYCFAPKNGFFWYLKGQYSASMGIGISIGFGM